ncbi:hypothetical protein AWB68_00518 [Caballeronia choica]|uniref:Uncharacterized protein n=1 Tax=Caballeronia choica TaxID=326476 RepID=A0A158FF49_9BURK|nr:hypothetical protein [Caballeronia choica]SAL17680.1 hypothetical protein AWB68_00518 [Caballeronia choica]
MNWLTEYFAQRTSPLNLALWAHPPLALGPDGPIARPAYHLSHTGVQLVYVPALVVKQGDRQYELPAHYDAVEPVKTFAFGAAPDEYVSQFFTDVSIYPPSRFNSDFLIRINDTLAFTPIFSAEGSPGFAGSSIDSKETATSPSQLKLPWTFQGYISI